MIIRTARRKSLRILRKYLLKGEVGKACRFFTVPFVVFV